MKAPSTYIRKNLSLHILVLVSGFVFCLFLTDILPTEDHFLSKDVTSAAESKDSSDLSDEDFVYSDELFELIFLESADQADLPSGMNGSVVLKQGITAIKSAFLTLNLDNSFFFKRKWLVSPHGLISLLHRPLNHPSTRFWSFASSIAINAP